ncbi:hypothetical protein ALC62_09362 [Cyphomyrmex costatus]|uniref:Uncharacterized protein n=1 Tax=Cyphomyrmex costatus TaxID=456900 RepID=A0A195CG69_9HYME|nr:hypothetical protein ALC62_09362 [Cyphomyrmex costatus]
MAAPWCGFDRNAGKERKSQRRTRRWKASERTSSVAGDSAVREGYPALKSERKKSGQSNQVPKVKEEEGVYEKKGRKESDGAIPQTRDRGDDKNPEEAKGQSLAFRSKHESSTVLFEPRISGAQRCESAATCPLPFVNELLRAYGHSSPGINYIVSLTPPSSVMNLRAHVNAEFECARDPGRNYMRQSSMALPLSFFLFLALPFHIKIGTPTSSERYSSFH